MFRSSLPLLRSSLAPSRRAAARVSFQRQSMYVVGGRSTLKEGIRAFSSFGVPPPIPAPMAPPVAKKSSVESKKEEGVVYELGNDLLVNSAEFKGHILVHIRQYWRDDKSPEERKPSKMGITLRATDLTNLGSLFDDIDADIKQLDGQSGDFAPRQQLVIGYCRNVDVCMQQSVIYIRFEHMGSSGKKEVYLTTEQYALLKQWYPTIQNSVTSDVKKIYDNSSLFEVKLSDFTMAKVIKLGDKAFIDIRKTSQPSQPTSAPSSNPNHSAGAPPAGGISIRAEEWETFVAHIQPLYAAVGTGDLNYQLPLSPNRKVTLSHYKSNWYLSIREFFTPKNAAEGTMLPSKKGINMPMDEWQIFANNIPQLTEHLRSATPKE